MKKLLLLSSLIVGAVFMGNGINNTPDPISLDSGQTQKQSITAKKSVTLPNCDGLSITSNCTSDGVQYASYVYHEAVPEKSHDETVTTYKDEVSGYCTLCNDGTYSPSCATGRGACSHHDGVAQWNAPIHRNVQQYLTKKIIDAPAQEAYYEKSAK